MNLIVRIGGLPVKARHRKLDSWEISQKVDGKHIVFSASRSTRGQELEIDQRAVRDEFLAIKNPADAFEFLKKFGPFQRDSSSNLAHKEAAPDVQFAALQMRQHQFREFIETPSPECFERDENASLRTHISQSLFHSGPSPVFTVELGHVRYKGYKHPSPFLQQYADDVFSAVYNSIYIDKMAGARAGICERCEKVFLSHSDRPARFCSKKCGNAFRQSARRKILRGGING